MKLSQREQIIEYVKEKYETVPDAPFRTSPDTLVIRHRESRKWYGLFIFVKRSTLGLKNTNSILEEDEELKYFSGVTQEVLDQMSDEYVDAINIKVDEMLLDALVQKEGYIRAYHMSKRSWVTIVLDGTVDINEILDLIDMSYMLTATKKDMVNVERRDKKFWLVPANPKYYDVYSAFEQSNVIDWKQVCAIKPGDLVYLYVTAPVCSIIFKCEAVVTDIPHPELFKTINIKKLMEIKLLDKYEEGVIDREFMKEYGVVSVRSQRAMPVALKNAIDKIYPQE